MFIAQCRERGNPRGARARERRRLTGGAVGRNNQPVCCAVYSTHNQTLLHMQLRLFVHSCLEERTAVLQGLARSSTRAKRFLCEACPRLAASASRSSEGVMYDATIRAINPSG